MVIAGINNIISFLATKPLFRYCKNINFTFDLVIFIKKFKSEILAASLTVDYVKGDGGVPFPPRAI